ncbi:hypothetical protein CTI12_AA290280 [Artemisia annua]|uniref:RRM domain-containing protein n=1 Tax=Artemisia annua TaxID=35608 RepID=A0A2U1N9W6_ARTAN|nr:hypothetical protein CTI12_AA290280 [Artemisia annua]
MVIRYKQQTDSEGWIWRIGKKGNATAAKTSKPISNPYTSPVESIASKFYITNFPPKWDSKNLWEWCMVHGKLVDVYVANKMSKVGKRFGFIRFMGVGDEVEFAKKLSFEWIGSYHVYVSVARFKRSYTNRRERPGMAKHTPMVNNHGIRSQASYAKVVAGKEQADSVPRSKDIRDASLKSVNLEDKYLITLDDSAEMVLAKKFKNKASLRAYLSDINPVMRNIVVDERMVWIEIEGLPLCAWGSEALKKIGRVFGTFMFFDNDSGENVSCGRLCIRTSHKSIISEMINVVVAGVSYMVRIHEVGIWSIDIQKQNEESDSNLSMDESEEVDMQDDLDMYVNDYKQVEDGNGSQNGVNVRSGEVNDTEMSTMKINEGGVSTNDSKLNSCPPGFEFLKREKNNGT